MNSEVAKLAARIERLEQVERENAILRCELRRDRRRLRVQLGLAFAAIVFAVLASPANRAAIAQGTNNLIARVTELETKTQFLSVAADPVTGTQALYVRGTNVHILNASPTGSADGLGNLIIGENRSRTSFGGTDERTGSHNLVIGDGNNYTGRSGVVIGDRSSIGGFQSYIFGANSSTATGGSSIFGGRGNDAGLGGHIYGGVLNRAQHGGCVLGGEDNFAGSFEGNVVVGGESNSSIASFNTVIGGFDNHLFGFNDHRTLIGGL